MNLVPARPPQGVQRWVYDPSYKGVEVDMAKYFVSTAFWEKAESIDAEALKDTEVVTRILAEAEFFAADRLNRIEGVADRAKVGVLNNMRKSGRFANLPAEYESIKEVIQALNDERGDEQVKRHSLEIWVGDILPALEKHGVPASAIIGLPDGPQKMIESAGPIAALLKAGDVEKAAELAISVAEMPLHALRDKIRGRSIEEAKQIPGVMVERWDGTTTMLVNFPDETYMKYAKYALRKLISDYEKLTEEEAAQLFQEGGNDA